MEALQRAKRVVEEQYAVVGVLEDMNSTLLAFEKYIPRFFTGALRMYWGKCYLYVCNVDLLAMYVHIQSLRFMKAHNLIIL